VCRHSLPSDEFLEVLDCYPAAATDVHGRQLAPLKELVDVGAPDRKTARGFFDREQLDATAIVLHGHRRENLMRRRFSRTLSTPPLDSEKQIVARLDHSDDFLRD
jgi:hypothetical protein